MSPASSVGESYNSLRHERLKTFLLNVHVKLIGIFLCFTAGLANMEENAYTDAVALRDGEKPNRARKLSAIVLDRHLRNLYRGIENPPGDQDDAILLYLQAAVHTFDNAYDRAVDEA